MASVLSPIPDDYETRLIELVNAVFRHIKDKVDCGEWDSSISITPKIALNPEHTNDVCGAMTLQTVLIGLRASGVHVSGISASGSIFIDYDETSRTITDSVTSLVSHRQLIKCLIADDLSRIRQAIASGHKNINVKLAAAGYEYALDLFREVYPGTTMRIHMDHEQRVSVNFQLS